MAFAQPIRALHYRPRLWPGARGRLSQTGPTTQAHHLGHRERLRERALKSLDALPDYELLELFLQAGIGRLLLLDPFPQLLPLVVESGQLHDIPDGPVQVFARRTAPAGKPLTSAEKVRMP